MKYNPDIHHRCSIRLKDYDYSQSGSYFVTICTQNKECLFGEIVDGSMILNDAGEMVQKWWMELKKKYGNIELDKFIVMPNHIHGIISIVGADLRVCPDKLPLQNNTKQGEHTDSPLHRIIQWFKTMTTNVYIDCVKKYGWPRFDSKLWQRNYYEHVIRSENDLNSIREYIAMNPMQWNSDEENPSQLKKNK